MNLLEKAKSKVPLIGEKNVFTDEQWELAKGYISGEVTQAQCMFALGRGRSDASVYPWITQMVREAYKRKLIKFK